MIAKDTFFSTKNSLNLKGNLLDVSYPRVMGILNLTPDSFYDGGRYVTESAIVEQAEIMLQAGAAILDLGGYSSRPGAADVNLDEEKTRVTNGIKFVLKHFPEAFISVDTFRSEVAEAALDQGACMVNDISGGEMGQKMYELIAKWNVPYVLMHMRGTPQNMVNQTDYHNLLLEIIEYFQKKIFRLKQLGLNDIILDPGFGFAKTANQSFQLLSQLNKLRIFELPVMVGVSRKSMIYKTLGIDIENALNGTTVLNTIGLMNGASILRVHDVPEAMQCVKLFKKTYF
ncbi:MAG: dihydropteroate synthase [Candidatus Cyclobacteriaceae bacterium M3_2C_046]